MPSTHKIIRKKYELKKLIKHCKETGYASVDFETNAMPIPHALFYPTILGVSFQPGSSWILPLAHFDSKFKKDGQWVSLLKKFGEEIIENKDIIKIAQNAKFEYQIFKRYGIEMKGYVFDTMLAKHLLDENTPNGLKPMVDRFIPEYSGYAEDYEGSHLPWNEKPLKGLSQYCGLDCDLTFRLMLYFEKKLIDGDFFSLFRNMHMMATRVLGDSEYSGMKIDTDYLDKLIITYKGYIKDNDGKVRNIRKVRKFQDWLVQHKINKLIDKVSGEINDLNDEIDGLMDAGAEQKVINRKSKAIQGREGKIDRYLAREMNTKTELKCLEPINFASVDHMRQLLFHSPKGYKFPIIKYTIDKQKNETDNASTAEDVLLELKELDKTEFIESLLHFRGISKLDSTYVSGMKKHITEGYVHANFLIHGAVTGRLSCKRPNLQNIPRDTTSKDIKTMFVPPKGYYLLQCIMGDSLLTTNNGLVALDKIDIENDKLRHLNKDYKIDRLIEKGEKEVFEIVTNTGRKLRMTSEHPLKATDGFKKLSDTKIGDTLFIENSIVDGKNEIDTKEAYLVGLFYGDGSYKSGNGINFSTGLDRDELLPILEKYFKIKPHVNKSRPYSSVYVINKEIKEKWLERYPKNNSGDMRIPKIILEGSLESKKHFIGGLIDSDGSVYANRIRYSSKSEFFIDDLLLLFNSVGMYGIKTESHRETNYGKQDIYHIVIYSKHSISKIIGYNVLDRKAKALNDLIRNKSFSQCRTEFIPEDIYQHIDPDHNKVYRAIKNGKRKNRMSRNIINNFIPYTNDSRWVDIIKYRYETIRSITPIGIAKVYDITVPGLSMFNPNGIIVHNCDYSQAELRVMAAMAGEETMIRWFKEGKDIHLTTALKMYKEEHRYDEVAEILRLEDDNDPRFKEWKVKRKYAKTINFGIIYGQGPPKLAEALGWTVEEAKKFLKDYFELFPNVKKFINSQHGRAHRDAFVKNVFGRKRRLIGIDSDENWERAEAERQCVDDKTQALTKEGWKYSIELNKGEDILTKNPITGELEWQHIEELNIYPDFKGDLYKFKNKSFDALTTGEHKWLANVTTKRNTNKFYTSKELHRNKLRLIHRQGYYKGSEKTKYSNDLISFIGWILTDGSLRYYNLPNKPRHSKPHYVTLTQSYRANPEKVEIIRSLIKRLGFKCRINDNGSSYNWRFEKNIADTLHSIIPNKKLTMAFILSLSIDQLRVLHGSMLLGDGHRGGNAIITGKKDQADMIQVVNILLGRYSNINTRDNIGRLCYSDKITNKKGYVEIKNKSYSVTTGSNKFFHTKSTRGKNHITKLENQQQLVWCPTVKNQSWVARRNGKQYITGNSVNAPIQGAASDYTLFSSIIIWEEMRKANIPIYIPQVYTVHDSLGYYVRGEDIHTVVPMLEKICANPQTKEWFGFQIDDVVMKVDFEVSKTDWQSLKSYDPSYDYTAS